MTDMRWMHIDRVPLALKKERDFSARPIDDIVADAIASARQHEDYPIATMTFQEIAVEMLAYHAFLDWGRPDPDEAEIVASLTRVFPQGIK